MGDPIIQKSSVLNSFDKTLQSLVKRIIDMSVSSFLLIVLSPLFFLIATVIYLEDRESIIFKQIRTGKKGNSFCIYKFRSMKVKKNQRASPTYTHNWSNGVPDDFVFKNCSEWHPDVTSVGKFIRKSSLDELPQLFNVLKGEMSLVGPRPEIPEITKYYDALQRKRLEVKPGITGWAQVNGRSEINHGEKVRFDSFYVDHMSLKFDFRIIILTFLQVLKGKGSV